MALIYTLDKSTFSHLFDMYKREDSFTSLARDRLYDYLSGLSEDMGSDIEVDVIEICCNWSEYTEWELVREYGHLCDSDTDIDELVNIMREHTILLEVEHYKHTTYIVEAF